MSINLIRPCTPPPQAVSPFTQPPSASPSKLMDTLDLHTPPTNNLTPQKRSRNRDEEHNPLSTPPTNNLTPQKRSRNNDEEHTPLSTPPSATKRKRPMALPTLQKVDLEGSPLKEEKPKYKCIIASSTPFFPTALLNNSSLPKLNTLQGGTSGALLLDQNLVVKFAHGELGTPYRQLKFPNSPCAKSGILPGEGTFGEFLAARLMQIWLAQCPAHILIPESAFVNLTHPEQLTLAESESVNSIQDLSSLIDSKATLHVFISQCRSFKALDKEGVEKLDLKACQLTTLFDLVLLNADGNRGNLLIDKENRLVLIDRSCILPRNAESAVVSCTAELPQVQAPIDPLIRDFILKTLSSDLLPSLLKEMEAIPDANSFDENRIQMHKWAVALVKAGTIANLSLSQIAFLFKATSRNEDFAARSVFHVLINTAGKRTIEEACKHCIALFQNNAGNRTLIIQSIEEDCSKPV